MSASSAASSSLVRSRTPIVLLTIVAAACGIYYLHTSTHEAAEDGHAHGAAPGLHRSNAVHRRSRRNTQEDEQRPLLMAESNVPDEDAEIVARPLADGETVVDDQAYHDDYNWDSLASHQRTGQNIVQLLFRVSEEATRRNAYVHRGCECNSCGVVPIRGIRYRCSNCADYDLCEGCESQGLHSKTHIFYKVKVPAPSSGPRHMQPVWYTGDPDTTFRPLQKAMIVKLNRETGFERPELDAYWEQWTYMANTEWREDPDGINLAMDRKTFERCLVPSGSYQHSAPSLIFDRMFAFYDTNRDDLISFPEFLQGLAYRKKKDKGSKIFEVYDIDGDGYVERKDFLRMFRSYYVLYRQMHRDLLESMDEQQMSSTDAHRLITSRQPLSSAFGNDGRFPPAPDPRTGEGKTVLPNGDMEISDGKDVINESSDDTGNREDIFRNTHHDRVYWDAVLNPQPSFDRLVDRIRSVDRDLPPNGQANNRYPTLELDNSTQPSFEQVMDVIMGVRRSSYTNGPVENGHTAPESANNRSSSRTSSVDSAENREIWPPRYVNVTDEDAEAIDGPGSTLLSVSPSSRPHVIEHAIQRERADHHLYERWKKRQFYTDEEEGAVPPAHWKEEDDVLARNGLGESSKNPPRPRVHSRSSSKVRFAEELDDLDTRSNPSTSSRSVPERWGGMEIPDAERDVGKEILYQVTQQAFNELLDPFFKEREDEALRAAATKADRDKYRYLYNTPDFEAWAVKRGEEEEQARIMAENEDKFARFQLDQDGVEVEHMRARPLEALLAETGITIEGDAGQGNGASDSQQDRPSSTGQDAIERNINYSLNTLLNLRETASPRSTSSDLLSIIHGDQASSRAIPTSSEPELLDSQESPSSEERHDPTLPQFRPNSPADIALPPSPPLNIPLQTQSFLLPSTASPPQPPTDDTQTQKEHPPYLSNYLPVSPDHLYWLWKLDREERRMHERGGWARLSQEEFLAIVRRQVDSGRGNQMDYLGSWVEFCLP